LYFVVVALVQVAKIVNRNKGALTYNYRQCLPLKAMGVYMFEGACKYSVHCILH